MSRQRPVYFPIGQCTPTSTKEHQTISWLSPSPDPVTGRKRRHEGTISKSEKALKVNIGIT